MDSDAVALLFLASSFYDNGNLRENTIFNFIVNAEDTSLNQI